MDDGAEVVEFYAQLYDEAARGESVSVQIEFVRTQEIVRRYLTRPGLRVADIGGGPGVHARWLANDGHHVTLVDPVVRHSEAARQIEPSAGSLRAETGDARRLDLEDGGFDAVLLLGPLYHLPESEHRLMALSEAKRILKPGGILFAAGISRFAALHDGFAREMLFEPGFREMAEHDLATGVHLNPGQRPGWFTTAYFHRPEELEAELAASGLSDVEVLGLEGLAGWLPNLDARWADPHDRQMILDVLAALESEPSLRGASAHLLGVGTRPK
jgi:ubiquinone/menaquinone biosynthesis C-methylase UbiE